MAKHDDALMDRADKLVVSVTPPTMEPKPDDDIFQPAPERLRKVPGRVNDLELDTIHQAVTLKKATLAHLAERVTDGEALTMICEAWLITESARLSGKGGGGG